MNSVEVEPERLWHYTSQEGLRGIVGDGRIWATNIAYLNDDAELRHGIACARSLIQTEYAADGLWSFVDTQYLRLRVERTAPIEDDVDAPPSYKRAPWAQGVFVFSPTEDPDSLSQWRGYTCAGDAYSIGFEKAWLDERVQACGWRLQRCVYDDEDARELLRPILDSEKRGQGWSTSGGDVFESVSSPIGRVVEAAALIKHPKFEEEREWRIITSPSGHDVKFRNGASHLIPYLDLPLVPDGEPRPNLHVRVGPGPSMDRALSATYAFVRSSCVPASPGYVQRSTVPYRTW